VRHGLDAKATELAASKRASGRRRLPDHLNT
jgi:hypothetical protein